MKVKLLVLMLTAIFYFSSCNNNNAESEPTILDLRIKKDGVPATSRIIKEHGTSNEDGSVQTTHVKAEQAPGGILFTINRPSGSTYDNGFGYVAIYRIEEVEVGQTTVCVLPYGQMNHEPVLYPLCEPGETYDFKVQLSSPESNDNGRIDEYYEFLTITAQDGIGDIDYSPVDEKQWVTVTQDGDDVIVELNDCIPPEAENVVSYIQFFLGDEDWNNPNTKWFRTVVKDSIEFTSTEAGIISDMKQANATQFFVQYSFKFTHNDHPQFSEIRTISLSSNVVTIE